MHKEFKAFVEQDKFDDTPFLKITHNGYQFQTIRIDDPLQEIPIIISVLQEYFAGYCTGRIKAIESRIRMSERNYQKLAQHHNDKCTCMDIY